MFQSFLRARAHTLLRTGSGEKPFRARSIERDEETDRQRISGIFAAIEAALSEAEREQAGLSRRVDDVLARASVTFGNGTDEYLDREELDNHHHDLFDIEIENGQRRLRQLATSISHLKFLKTVLLTRFPDFKANAVA